MFCTNCGKQSDSSQKFCISCGTPFHASNKNNPKPVTPSAASLPKSETSITKKVVWGLVILAFIGFGIYSSLDDDAIETNNQGISSFDSGNSEQAIQQFQEAANSAVSNDTKLNTLKNLGYVYSSEGQNDLALNSFKEALSLATVDSFDYYLISGEVALLEGKPNAAQISYTKAYNMSPNNFQINNALNLFHLDLEEIAPQYSNYPKALTHAKKAYEVSSVDVKNIATQNLGISHFLNENYDQAISFLSPYANSEPYASFWLGLAYLSKEDHINAKIYLRKALNGGVEMPQEYIDYLNS